MKRPILRRLLAVTGSVTLGLMGAVALASPAQAHHTTVRPISAACTPDEWIITWSVENWETDMTAKITDVSAKPNTAVKLSNGTTLKGATLPGSTSKLVKGKRVWTYGKLVAEQRVPLATKEAELAVTALWPNKVTEKNKGTITLNPDTCGDHKAEITGWAECDKDAGQWIVKWTVANKHFKDRAILDIITQGAPDSEKTATKKADGQWVTLKVEQDIAGFQDGTPINGGQSKFAVQVVEGSSLAARLKVQLKWDRNHHQSKTDTQVHVVEFQGACVKNAPKPTAVFASDCSGIVTVTLMNSDSATKSASFVVNGAGGWTTEPVEVLPGKAVTITVPASASSSITVLESGAPVEKGTYSWADSPKCHPIEITTDQSCNKFLVTIKNPEGGAPATVVLTPVKGSTPAESEQALKDLGSDAVTKTVAPGTAETVEFDAGDTGLVVHVSVNGDQRGSFTWKKPSGCEPLDGEVVDTCEGLVFDLKNPADGRKTDLVLTPSKGEAVSFTLNPGESKKVEFKADKELTVKVTQDGKVVDEIEWTKPEKCDSPAPSPSPSAPPTLPKTGTNVTIFVISGLLLVAVGFAVFMLARRRRLNMTEV